MDEHGAVIEYEFWLRGADVRDVFRPGTGLTPRRVLSLCHELSRTPGSSLAASVIGDDSWRGWTREAGQAADAVDSVHHAIYVMMRLKGARSVRRPGNVAWRPSKPRKHRTLTDFARAVFDGKIVAREGDG